MLTTHLVLSKLVDRIAVDFTVGVTGDVVGTWYVTNEILVKDEEMRR